MRKRASPFLAAVALALALGTAGSLFLGGTALAQQRRTLYWGLSGPDVVLVQSTLSDWGYYFGSIDGFYGNDMVRSVTRFQRYNGLRADGVVGRSTWEALGFPEPSPPVARYGGGAAVARNGDVDLLARLIMGEAGEEPYEGQVAVAAVILNRVRSPIFPNSLAGVIYEPWAFESVMNGFVWARTPSQSTYNAAIDALNGWDPTYGALFFWNPATASSPWVWSRQIIRWIGRHVFAR